MGVGCEPVEWSIDTEGRKIRYCLTSVNENDEWVAVGISENGGTKGADIAIVKQLKPEVCIADDTFSMGFESPKSDVLQNVELISARRADVGRLVAVIERDLDTCDKDDPAIESHKQYLVCASGNLDDDGSISHHGGNHHSQTVNLLVDEELLMDRKFPADIGLSNGVEVARYWIYNRLPTLEPK